MSDNYLKQSKIQLDPLDDTNMRVNLEFKDGELFAIYLEVLPLSSDIKYRLSTDSLSYPIKMELLTIS